LVVSRSTGKKAIVVAAPVESGGKIIGALGSSIYLVQMARKILKNLNLPENMYFHALDNGGQTMLHVDESRIFDSPAQLGFPSLTTAIETISTNDGGWVDYEFQNSKLAAVYGKSPLTGWKLTLVKKQ
jgi:methyl-accepting chemotaxis protein